MAILNSQELFSDDQAITATAASTNVIDFGTPGTPIRAAAPIVDEKGVSMIPLAIQVTEDFDNLTSLTIAVQTDNNAAFSSATTVHSQTIALASLVAGAKTALRMIPFNTTEQYVRLHYTVTGTAPTTGKITAGVASLESPFGNR